MPLDQIRDLPEGEKEMSFFDHLEELRWHLIRSLLAVFILSIVAFFSKEFLFGKLILGPAKTSFFTYRAFCHIESWWNARAIEAFQLQGLCIETLNFSLQSRQMTGQFTMHITASIVAGFVVAFPYVFWEIWRFIKPGLYLTEKSATQGIVISVSVLFMIGVLFGYYVIAPLSINFLANYQIDPLIVNQFDITSYVSTLIFMVLASGLMFQLPMVVFLLTKVGILTPTYMRTYRKHATIVIMLLAAFITPSPDAFSMMLVAVPLYFLYEISIYISAWELKKRVEV